MGETSLTDFFDGYIEQFADIPIAAVASNHDDIFSTLEALDQGDELILEKVLDHKSSSSCTTTTTTTTTTTRVVETETPKGKRQKVSGVELTDGTTDKVSHITVERNRRKQMNEHLTVLRSLMPCFYVKRGDQASIIGGVVDYITELQQVLQSLEAKKQRKVYTDHHHHVLSPGRSSPRKPPISPRPVLLAPISPRTPQPLSPAAYRPTSNSSSRLQQQPLGSAASTNYFQPSATSMTSCPSPATSSNSSNSDVVVNSSSISKVAAAAADVEVKFCGSNLVLKTMSPQLPGQTTKIVSVLEDLSLEILHVGINTVNETLVNSFTIKIGIECQLSVEDLVQYIQHTFC